MDQPKITNRTVRLLKQFCKKFSKLQKIIIILVIIIIGLAIFINLAFTRGDSQTPPYQTLLPSNKSIEQLGGWNSVKPPQNDTIYIYTDTLDGVTIQVSQQPLPSSFKSDPDTQIASLAKSYNANDKISDENITLFIGNSAKGPQSVITSRSGLLILIKSANKISDVSWMNYVGSMK